MLQRVLFAIVSVSASISIVSAAEKEPVRLILDTDIGNDIDDALALAMIHSFENHGEVQLLAVTITKDNRYAPKFVSVVNAYYNRPDIPIGMVKDGKTPDDAPMLKIPVERRRPSGELMYQRPTPDTTGPADAVELLTRVLSAQPDHSVTVAQIGFSTNLARLIKDPSGLALVRRKVRVLCLMAGNFVDPKPEYNVYTDPDSARALLASWPTPMIFSGFEIGLKITFPYSAFQNVKDNPVADAFRVYVSKPEDHPNWDSTAVLEAIRPDAGYFDLSPPGHVTLGPNNTTTFTLDAEGNCRYLKVKPEHVSTIRTLIERHVLERPQLASQTSQRIVF